MEIKKSIKFECFCGEFTFQTKHNLLLKREKKILPFPLCKNNVRVGVSVNECHYCKF